MFITMPSSTTPGSLSDIAPDSNGFTAFLRLVGVAYMTKHAGAFPDVTPTNFFDSFHTSGSDARQQHNNWYEKIRARIWERITFEDQLPPNTDALQLHWLRSIWVIDYWRQANSNPMLLLPIEYFGWKHEDDHLYIVWDAPQNLQMIHNCVAFLTHGCGCMTGCSTARCKCVKAGQPCGPGCICYRASECQNKGSTSEGT